MISVKRSLSQIVGVSKAEVSLKQAEAVVTFDGARTTVEALTKATASAGFPSKLKACKP